MSRLAWVAPACVLAAVVTGALLGGPASAEEPTSSPSPTPSPTGTSQLLPVLPTPTPTPSAAPVSQLRAAVDTAGALVVTWRAGSGDTSYTVTATAAGRTHRVEATDTTASFSGLPAGTAVQIVVVARGAGGDSIPVTITGAMPSAVPGVTGAAMHPAAAGMLVSWQAPANVAAGTRYLVQLHGADGAVRSRLVTGTTATVTGLTRGVLYTGSITAVTDTGRSAPVTIDGAVWTPPTTAGGPIAAPQSAPSSAPSATAVPHTAAPVLADSPARRTLVSSPMAAGALAGVAVLLGGIAIGLLLRRPKARPAAPPTQSSPLVRTPHP
jgi:hypothetical protein